MFEVGDAVVHPTSGAGIVLGLMRIPAQQDVGGYYKIKIVGKTKTVIMVPVKRAEELGLRYATPKGHLEQVWHILSDVPETLPSEHKKRYKLLEDKLKTQEIFQVARVVRDLEWRRLQEERLNAPGKRIYDRAMKLLAGEIAVSQGVGLQDAESRIRDMLGDNLSTRFSETD